MGVIVAGERLPLCEEGDCVTWPRQHLVRLDGYTPTELNIEPKNGQIHQENDLPRCHFRAAMFGLQIVKVQKWNTFIVSGKNTGLE